jgi:hypothetical protein
MQEIWERGRRMKIHVKCLVLACLLFCLFFSSTTFSAVSATSPTVSLSFYKRLGFGFFSDMAGAFTAIANVSSDVIRVEFYLDNQLKLNDSASPFQWDFDTSNYSLGPHHFEVIAYNSAGESAHDSRDVNFVQEPFPPYFAVFLFLALVVMPILLLFLAISGRIPASWRKGRNATSAQWSKPGEGEGSAWATSYCQPINSSRSVLGDLK